MTAEREREYVGIRHPSGDARMVVLAYIDDLTGRKSFLRDEAGGVWYVAPGAEAVPADEGIVASAVTKHGYRLAPSTAAFPYRERGPAIAALPEE